MGIDIKLTDRQLPLSPSFLDFIHNYLQKKGIKATWHDQLSEGLIFNQKDILKNAQSIAKNILEHEAGRDAVIHVYGLLVAILTGQVAKLEHYHHRYDFINIVGAPRHGGSYLTKQLFRALGIDPYGVPDALAHDGFPEAAPFAIVPGVNTHILLMHNIAEYFTMLDLFFANTKLRDGRVVVPKKLTKAAYHGAVFTRLLGSRAEYIITLRHPIRACISTYEKSGGLPEDGKFKMRGKIEEWIRRDNTFNGIPDKAVMEQDYFEVYLRYWEMYHYNLATSGLQHARNIQVVTYGESRMTALAQSFFERFDSNEKAEKFHVFDSMGRHPEWVVKAEAALMRVKNMWGVVGLHFPLDEVMEAW